MQLVDSSNFQGNLPEKQEINTRAVTEGAHYALKAQLQFSFLLSSTSLFPLNLCGHVRAGNEGNPHDRHRKSPHSGRKHIFHVG